MRENFEVWQMISNKMLPNARELCEQLRLILEPTKCTRLKGDYRTGRRINMKKVKMFGKNENHTNLNARFEFADYSIYRFTIP